jgi:CO/xanthine dehydrogenase Mo-binding subunit
MTHLSIDRRSLFQGAGALVVSIGIPGGFAAAARGAAVKPPLAPDQLDSWLAVKSDGDVVAYFGKMDMGQGVDVAIAQIVAEELDVPFKRVSVVMGDTTLTVNQGGASGSTGVQKGGIALRNAAAEARRVLVEMASARLGVAADQLEAADGVVAVTGDPARKISYGELIGGRYFDVPMTWNGKLGSDLVAEGQAKPKPPAAYKIVGQSPPRFDVPAKVFGRLDYVTDIKVPGMLHGRMIRPPVAGAVPVAVDDGPVNDIPGIRVVRDKGFIGIVAEREWDAVQAAERLRVTWSDAAPPFPEMAALYDHIRQAPVLKRDVPVATGEIDPAFAGAARVVEAEYEWPFQSHASMGPACAVVDARADEATLWTGSQKPHFARDGVARALGLPQAKVHGIWVPGPGSYGRNDAGDAGIDAALLSKAVDRRTGKVWARRFTVAHDCGLIINPDGLKRCIEGNVVQGTRRALSEEVAFDRTNVSSVDWVSYPILDITEAPEVVDIVLINRPELPPAGAGESSIRPVAAAIANAVFDASGVRLRRVPMTPERLKPGLA